VLHVECRALLVECPTLGCKKSAFTLVRDRGLRSRPSRPAFRRGLAGLVALHESGRLANPFEPRPRGALGVDWAGVGLVFLPLRFIFATIALALFLGSVVSVSSWIELLTQGRVRSRRLDALLGWLRETFLAEWSAAPLFLVGAACLLAVSSVTLPEPESALRGVGYAALALFFAPGVLAWRDATVARGESVR
jgi:hypothetical protein